MNTYVILACVLAVAGISHGSAIGYGGLGYGHGAPYYSAPLYAPAAISTANMVKAAPISVIRTVPVPVSMPIVKSVPVSVGWNGLGGWGGLGWGGLGWGGLGYGGLGYGGLGVKSSAWGNSWGGWGWNGHH